MTTLREAAQQALEALGLWATGRDMDAVKLNDLIHGLEAALYAAPKQQTQTCSWRYNLDAFYETECGNLYIINDGSPEDNDMMYCCYCGKEIKDESPT